MKRALVAVLFGCMTLGFSSLAFAGNNIQAGIALHVGAAVAKNACDALAGLTNATVVTDADATLDNHYYVYLLVCNGSDRDPAAPSPLRTGVAGFQCGIDYGPAITVDAWVRCADQDFPQLTWPAPNSGNTVTWSAVTNCQDQNTEPFVPGTVMAIGGYFDVYTTGLPEIMAVINRPVDGKAKVVDCNFVEDDITFNTPSQLGIVSFGASLGYNPCGGATPVESTTWGAIKKNYE